MKEKIAKILEYIAVIASILIGVIVSDIIPYESILKGQEESVSLTMTEHGLPEDYIGKPADDDIPRIEDAETWEDTWQTSYVTIEPIGIISTGFGTRHPWVDAYTNASRRGGARRRADVTRTMFDILDEYGEYYILQLPDESYILAQMSASDAGKIMAGNEITLPVGRKAPTHSQVLSNITSLCREYDVNTDGVFYCIDDQWNEEHSTMLLFIRIGAIAVITIVLSVILIMIIDKLFGKKDIEQGQ